MDHQISLASIINGIIKAFRINRNLMRKILVLRSLIQCQIKKFTIQNSSRLTLTVFSTFSAVFYCKFGCRTILFLYILIEFWLNYLLVMSYGRYFIKRQLLFQIFLNNCVVLYFDPCSLSRRNWSRNELISAVYGMFTTRKKCLISLKLLYIHIRLLRLIQIRR